MKELIILGICFCSVSSAQAYGRVYFRNTSSEGLMFEMRPTQGTGAGVTDSPCLASGEVSDELFPPRGTTVYEVWARACKPNAKGKAMENWTNTRASSQFDSGTLYMWNCDSATHCVAAPEVSAKTR